MLPAHSKLAPCRVCKRPITSRQGYLQVTGEEPRHYDCQRARILTLEDLLRRILASYDDGSINVPDVDEAIEAEIRGTMEPVDAA